MKSAEYNSEQLPVAYRYNYIRPFATDWRNSADVSGGYASIYSHRNSSSAVAAAIS